MLSPIEEMKTPTFNERAVFLPPFQALIVSFTAGKLTTKDMVLQYNFDITPRFFTCQINNN